MQFGPILCTELWKFGAILIAYFASIIMDYGVVL